MTTPNQPVSGTGVSGGMRTGVRGRMGEAGRCVNTTRPLTRDRALRAAEWETERRESAERWARRECAEQRRLQDRLTDVVAAAAALGVSIQAINAALDEADAKHSAPMGDE